MHAIESLVALQYAVFEHGKITGRRLAAPVLDEASGSGLYCLYARASWPCISRDVQEAGACPCWVLKSRRSRTMGKTAPTNPIWPDGVTRQNETRTSPLVSNLNSKSTSRDADRFLCPHAGHDWPHDLYRCARVERWRTSPDGNKTAICGINRLQKLQLPALR